MFDIAFSELVVIGLIALIVLGPKRLPEVARAAGKWVARIRRFVEDVKRDVDSEMRREELAELRSVQQQLTETRQIFESTTQSAMAGIADLRPPELDARYLVSAAPESGTPPRNTSSRTAKPARRQSAAPKRAKKTSRRNHVRARRTTKS